MRGGFALSEVMAMTVDQVRAYSQAVERARKRDHRDLLVLLRTSQYEAKAFTKMLNALEP